MFVVLPSTGVCACLGAIFFHAFYGSNFTNEGLHVYDLGFIHDWPTSLAVSGLRLTVVNATCATVSSVLSYSLAFTNGTQFAVENGTTDQWSSGASVTLPVDPSGPGNAGNLTIRTYVDLSLDRLAAARVPGGIEDLSALRPGYVPGTGIGSGGECDSPA